MFRYNKYIILLFLVLFLSCDEDGSIYTGETIVSESFADEDGNGDSCCLKRIDGVCEQPCYLDFSTAVPAPVTMISLRFKAAIDRPKSVLTLPSAGTSTFIDLLP